MGYIPFCIFDTSQDMPMLNPVGMNIILSKWELWSDQWINFVVGLGMYGLLECLFDIQSTHFFLSWFQMLT
jgi:hypothetical protein